MSDGNGKLERLRTIEVAAIAASILSFFGITLFPPRVISSWIEAGEFPPANEPLVLVTIMLGLARISFLLAYLFADSRIAQVLRRQCRRSLRIAQLRLLAMLPSAAAVNSALIVTLVAFAFFLGTLIDWPRQPENTAILFADRWPAQTQALPTFDFVQFQKWHDAYSAFIPVTYERPSESKPTAQLFADAKLGSKQDMVSLRGKIKDLLGGRELFVRSVELKHQKKSRHFYRMLAGPFESTADVIKFCRAYNKRFNLRGRAACLPESVSLEIKTTADETYHRRPAPRARTPVERLPEARGLDFIFPRLFNFDNII